MNLSSGTSAKENDCILFKGEHLLYFPRILMFGNEEISQKFAYLRFESWFM